MTTEADTEKEYEAAVKAGRWGVVAQITRTRVERLREEFGREIEKVRGDLALAVQQVDKLRETLAAAPRLPPLTPNQDAPRVAAPGVQLNPGGTSSSD